MVELLKLTALTIEQKQYADDISISSRHLLNIIDDILDFSKLENGKMILRLTPTSIKTVLEQAFLITHQQKYKHLSVSYNIDADVPTTLQADAMRLGQILINLLSNALKFTDNGKIHVEVNQVSISKEEQDEYYHKHKQSDACTGPNNVQVSKLKFSVSDTGIGINPDQFKNLFHSFVQLETSRTREYGGTGLGLVICHRLVELMHGKIWVESTLGKGTTFFFTIMAIVDSNVLMKNNGNETKSSFRYDQKSKSSPKLSPRLLEANRCINVMIVHPSHEVLVAFKELQHLVSQYTHIKKNIYK